MTLRKSKHSKTKQASLFLELNSADAQNPPTARIAYAWEVMRIAMEQLPSGALINAASEINRRIEVTVTNRMQREAIDLADDSPKLPFPENES